MATAYPNITRFLSARDVVPLSISWDAWVRNLTQPFGVGTTMIDPADPTSITKTYGYRALIKSDGSAYPENWYLLDSLGGTAAEQATFDDQLMMMAEAGLVRYFVWYPPSGSISIGPPLNESKIMQAGRDRHFASPRKNTVPFAYILSGGVMAYDGNTPGTWGNFTAFTNLIVADMLDPMYKKITFNGVANRPVVGLYETTPLWDATHRDSLSTAATTAGLGTPVYIQMNNNQAQANALCDYSSAYGPSGTSPLGAHATYAQIITNGVAVDDRTGYTTKRCLVVIHSLDTRPRNANWGDKAIYTQWEQHLRDKFGRARSEQNFDPAGLLCMYAINETDEGGDFFPTAQSIVRGVNSPSRGPILDALKNVRNGTFPSTYDDHYAAWSFHADIDGSLPAGWAIVQDLTSTGGTAGAFQYAELQNSTTTNARTLTRKCTRIRIYGGKGAGLGTIRFVLDGGANIDVAQDDGNARRYNQLLYDSGTLSNVSHTLAVSRVSGLAAFDEWVASISR